jgi:DNA-binding MarR family transcriptional regulator
MAAARSAMRRHGFRHLLGKSVSLTHLHVLSVLRMRGPLPVSEVARVLDVSAAGATGIASRMEERHLVVRKREGDDRRIVTVELAPGGEAALDEIEGRGREHFAGLLRMLTTEELEHLHAGLLAVRRASERQREATLETAEDEGAERAGTGGDKERASITGEAGGVR